MPYTPVELRHVHVKRSLLGYKRDAVENLLTELADNFETVWRERHELADQLEEIEHELGVLRSREQALTQTLVAAEQAATHVKDQAKRAGGVCSSPRRAAGRAGGFGPPKASPPGWGPIPAGSRRCSGRLSASSRRSAPSRSRCRPSSRKSLLSRSRSSSRSRAAANGAETGRRRLRAWKARRS